MGLYSTATISTDAVKLCVFDLRRGQREGDEVEKILFFYPSELPLTDQLSVIGLSEGLITFTRLVILIPTNSLLLSFAFFDLYVKFLFSYIRPLF